MSRTLRNALFALAAAIVVLAAAGFSYVAIMRHLTQEAESRNVLAGIGGPFTLTDQTGHKVSSSAYRGKLMLITFGYTYCPDVCPTTLTTMTDALDDLGAQADEVQPIFVTIDPERDTAKVLADRHPAGDRRRRQVVPRLLRQGDAQRRDRLSDGPFVTDLPDRPPRAHADNDGAFDHA